MHNRKRDHAPPSLEAREAALKKAAAYRGLARLASRQAAASAQPPAAPGGGTAAAAALAEGGADLSAQLLALNPEYYSLWNHRRRVLLRGRNLGGRLGAAPPSRRPPLARE